MQDSLRIFTLGGFQVELGGQSVDQFVSQRAEALLAYVAYNPSEHTRETLATMLWSDLPETRALGNLRVIVSNIQHVLGSHIVVTRHSIRINPAASSWLDARQMENMVNLVAQRRIQQGRLSRFAVAQLEEATNLYQGDFLAGLQLRGSGGEVFEEWVLLERERLRNRATGALHLLVQDALEYGDFGRGFTHARRLVELDPLLESAHRTLMMLLAQNGQTGAAIAQYKTCHRILETELGVEPDDETQKLYQEILQNKVQPLPVLPNPPNNLPGFRPNLVGRKDDLLSIAEQLDLDQCRLLSLIGQGGIGKTSLALEAGFRLLADYPDGVYFISLAAVTSTDSVIPAIAIALGIVPERQQQTRTQLFSFLKNKQMLLILDNFEHLLPAALDLLEILEQAQKLKIMVTSHQRLNVREEYVFPVLELDYPREASDKNALSYSAVQLFLQTAQHVSPDFSFEEHQVAIIRICRFVEGMPLGIELAAAWLHVISAEQIADEIERSLDVLAVNTRNIPIRQRSIRDTFDYSWNLLSQQERSLLLRLSVFIDSFDISSAQAVTGVHFPVLAALIDKSLIRRHSEDRYDFHEMIRRFIYEKLVEEGTAEDAERQLLSYFVQFAEHAQRGLASFEEPMWLEKLDQELGNLRSSMKWAVQHDIEAALKISSALLRYWQVRGYFSEGIQWLKEGLAAASSDAHGAVRAKALYAAGVLCVSQSNYKEAVAYLEESASIFQLTGEDLNAAYCLHYLGRAAFDQAVYDVALTYYQSGLEIGQRLGNRGFIGSLLQSIGSVAMVKGEHDEAGRLFSEGLALLREFGSLSNVAVGLNNLGAAKNNLGDTAEARKFYEEGLSISRTLKNQRGVAQACKNLAEIAIFEGKFDEAQAYNEESLAIHQKIGSQFGIAWSLQQRGELEFRRGNIDEAIAYIVQSLTTYKEYLSDVRLVTWCVIILGEVAIQQQQLERAARLFSMVNLLCESLSVVLPTAMMQRYKNNEEYLKSCLDPDLFVKLWSEVRILDVNGMIDYAIS